MIVLGVDPALSSTGYGVINSKGINKNSVLEAGVIKTSYNDPLQKRLTLIYKSLDDIITEFKPSVIVLEKLYSHYKHPATAILMGHARGVVCLLSGEKKINLADVSSTRIKKTITGNGHASKAQIKRMIEHIFNLENKRYPSDVTDALALAVGYVNLTFL